MAKHDELAQKLTAALIEAIDTTPGDWSRPWRAAGAAAYPHCITTGQPYRGANTFNLLMEAHFEGYATGQWATMKQWNSIGCRIQKGSTHTKVLRPGIVWHCAAKPKGHGKSCETPDCTSRPIFRVFHVFNAAQTEGEFPDAADFPTEPLHTLPGADDVRGFFGQVGSDWREVASDKAYYTPASDHIVTPLAEQFDTIGDFASTVAHEHIHWTGHHDRTPRDLTGTFGSESYALEELTAELGAVIVCNALGLDHRPLDTHGAYLANWLTALRSDQGPKLLWSVAGKAARAAEYITDRARHVELTTA